MKISMKKIWTARALIRNGNSVKEVAELLNMSENTVRNYTKAERKMALEAQSRNGGTIHCERIKILI